MTEKNANQPADETNNNTAETAATTETTETAENTTTTETRSKLLKVIGNPELFQLINGVIDTETGIETTTSAMQTSQGCLVKVTTVKSVLASKHVDMIAKIADSANADLEKDDAINAEKIASADFKNMAAVAAETFGSIGQLVETMCFVPNVKIVTDENGNRSIH